MRNISHISTSRFDEASRLMESGQFEAAAQTYFEMYEETELRYDKSVLLSHYAQALVEGGIQVPMSELESLSGKDFANCASLIILLIRPYPLITFKKFNAFTSTERELAKLAQAANVPWPTSRIRKMLTSLKISYGDMLAFSTWKYSREV